MSGNDAWSPDEPSGTEAFEQGDEALDDDATLDASGVEIVEQDPSLDPTLLVDELELGEAGALLDDPDGTGPRRQAQRGEEDAGWDLDAPLSSADPSEEDDG